MASTPSPRPPRLQLDYQLSFKRLDTVSEICKELIKWAGIVLLAYFGFRTIGVLAGRTTGADIALKVLGNLNVSRGVIALLAGGGWVYGLGQRALRRRHIKRIVPAKNELEKLLDPKRTSSDLTEKGTTPRKRKG
jgi:hypothetical protein